MFYSIIVIHTLIVSCGCQREAGLPLTYDSFSQIFRTTVNVPSGRSIKMDDLIFRFYGTNTTTPSSFQVRAVKRLLVDQNFDLQKPTLVYAHGYVELTSDDSVLGVVKAYLSRGGFNILVLDWANLAFGNYFSVTKNIPAIGKETGKALGKLLKRGLSLKGLHLVGHSLGAHVLSAAAKTLAAMGFRLTRLTGLDPAYPGFYPELLGHAISSSDAEFVDIVHTDGGGFGGPSSTGHADFWPNGGQAKQPGCLSATVLFTNEDFCSHWRSWEFWAESVEAGDFLARQCNDYDTFLRGNCQDMPLVYMGARATPDLRGNFYLRTGTKSPYALGERGAG